MDVSSWCAVLKMATSKSHEGSNGAWSGFWQTLQKQLELVEQLGKEWIPAKTAGLPPKNIMIHPKPSKFGGNGKRTKNTRPDE